MEQSINEQVFKLLLQKGFQRTFYQSQNLHFYTLEIKEPTQVEKLFRTLYPDYFLGEDYSFEGSTLVIETQEDFAHSQFIFLESENFDSFETIEEFAKFIEKNLPDFAVQVD